ncbi:54S ribosomal protein L10 [Penicillium angulare]|uniref:54S ribosomal protein L10 n=1 Tax=Penicillium angulare TaxID=116970 RepID=UPI00253FD9BF|nr:54S ribosomal protein L10 [Penicillium angulare]KAJ5291568.1 54S ribosomal protein L10 [Penicillium angulare]
MSQRLMGLPTQLQQFIARPLSSSPLLFLAPQFQQARNASVLSSLSDNPSAYNKRIRRGRGPASGKGKTSGRGHKGQKQHGKVPARFNGGQTLDIVVNGERGGTTMYANHFIFLYAFPNPSPSQHYIFLPLRFLSLPQAKISIFILTQIKNNLTIPPSFGLDMAPVNLSRIQEWIDQGRIDPTRPITVRELAQSRCIHQYKDGVKVLGDGSSVLKQPIHLVVSRASGTAISAIEAAGGTVATRFYTRSAIRHIMANESHPFISLQWNAESGSKALLQAEAKGAQQASEAEAGPEAGAVVDEQAVMKAKGYAYRLPDPARRRDIEYYRDPAHRGYLAHLLKPAEGPSLFFRSPEERKSAAGVKKEKVLPVNRLW